MKDRIPPAEHEMFRNVDQLRTESHMDATEANLADALHSSVAKAVGKSSMGATASSVLGPMQTTRSQLGQQGEKMPPKPGAQRQQHSQNRMETHYGREVSTWFESPTKDKLKREDAF